MHPYQKGAKRLAEQREDNLHELMKAILKECYVQFPDRADQSIRTWLEEKCDSLGDTLSDSQFPIRGISKRIFGLETKKPKLPEKFLGGDALLSMDLASSINQIIDYLQAEMEKEK